MTEPITITHSTEAEPFHRTAEIAEILKFQARKEVAP